MTATTSPSNEGVSLEQYGELEVKVIKLRRALAHAQSVTKRQDAALTKTIDKLQKLDNEVKDLKTEGALLEEEVGFLEKQLEEMRSVPLMTQQEFAEKEMEDAKNEIKELRYQRAKAMIDIEKQRLANREITKTIEIIQKRYEHEEKKRKYELKKLQDREGSLRRELSSLQKDKEILLNPPKTAPLKSGQRSRTHLSSSSSRLKTSNASGKQNPNEPNPPASERKSRSDKVRPERSKPSRDIDTSARKSSTSSGNRKDKVPHEGERKSNQQDGKTQDEKKPASKQPPERRRVERPRREHDETHKRTHPSQNTKKEPSSTERKGNHPRDERRREQHQHSKSRKEGHPQEKRQRDRLHKRPKETEVAPKEHKSISATTEDTGRPPELSSQHKQQSQSGRHIERSSSLHSNAELALPEPEPMPKIEIQNMPAIEDSDDSDSGSEEDSESSSEKEEDPFAKYGGF